jgi:hypothetical protein
MKRLALLRRIGWIMYSGIARPSGRAIVTDPLGCAAWQIGPRDPEILRRLTGLNLLAPGQQWRTEPYPFNGADPEPLEKGLPLTCEEVSATVAAYSAAKIKQARAQSV